MIGVWLAQVALAMVQVSPTLNIESDSRCPSAEMVAGALAALAEPPAKLRLSVMVRGSGGRLALEFSWPGNPATEVRELVAAGDCASRARSAAVSLASWIGLFPTAAPLAPSFPRRDPPSPAAPPSPSLRREPAAAIPVARPRPETWLGAGLYAAASAGIVPGLSIALERLRGGGGLRVGGRLVALASAPQSEMVGSAQSSWMRPTLLAGCVVGRNIGAVDAVVTFGAVGGLTFAWGSGYSVDKSARAFDGGVAGALRIGGAGTGRINPWFEVTAIRWLGAQRLRVDAVPMGTSLLVDLPRWEGLVSIGWSIQLS